MDKNDLPWLILQLDHLLILRQQIAVVGELEIVIRDWQAKIQEVERQP